jgi:hypothetical protein
VLVGQPGESKRRLKVRRGESKRKGRRMKGVVLRWSMGRSSSDGVCRSRREKGGRRSDAVCRSH